MNSGLSVDAILGPHGALAAALPGFEFRREQWEVASAVERAFEGRHYLFAEAGTGTGKTLAYLVPAILSGRKVLISTATRNLQEQIFFKDVPLLRQQLGLQFEAAYLKGRTNYLCLQRFAQKAHESTFRTPEEAILWPKLVSWAERTSTGDRAELDIPDDLPLWSSLTATSDTCLGQKCPAWETCFVTRMRRRAEEADVLVVNHHLFFADLALKTRPGGADVGVLPRYDAVIFDEAHALEDVASDYFGFGVSNHRVEELAADAQRLLTSWPGESESLGALIARLRFGSQTFFQKASVGLGIRHEGTFRLASGALSAFGGLDDLSAALSALGSFCASHEGPEWHALTRRSGEIDEHLQLLVEADRSDHVYWAEARGRGLFLRAAPIEVGPHLQRRLYAGIDTVIFTSATLTADGRFDYFARRMGLHPEGGTSDEGSAVETVSVPSPFDYRSQAALYVPDHLPDPADPAFVRAVADEIVTLARVTGGRAFALFTSLKNMEAAWQLAKERLPWQVLLQGERPKSALLEAFRSTPSVLFASHSFWEGVDVPGEALSLVIIDKLPFASPGDPRVAARIDHLRAQHQDPFSTYQLPGAAIALRQGFGRLIRSSQDVGIVAILDPRLRAKGYGRAFLRSLPPAQRVDDLDGLTQWFSARRRADDPEQGTG